VKSKFWLPPLLLSILVNVNVLTNQFVWDDVILIEQQFPGFQTLRDVLFPDLTIFQISKNYYRPLITLSFLWDQTLWNQEPFGYHLTVFLFHIGNTLLVFFLSRQLLPDHPMKNWIALLSSSLFAVHPIHTESVAWMSGRTDSISAFFMFFSMFCYSKYNEKNSFGFLVFSTIFLFLALCGKEVAIALLLLFPFFDFIQRRDVQKTGHSPQSPNLFTYLLPGVALLSYYALRHAALGSSIGEMQWKIPTEKNVFLDIILIAGFYLKKLLWPFNLQAFIPEIPNDLSHWIISIVLLVCFSILFGWAYWKKHFLITFSLTWVFLSLSPSLLVAFSSVSKTPLAERYLYIPSFGICLLTGFLLVQLFQSSVFKQTFSRINQILFMTLMIGLILIPWSWTTYLRNQVWSDNIAFWTDLTQKIPEYGLPHNNLAHAFIGEGRFQEAERELNLALQSIYEDFGKSLASSSLGNLYRVKGEEGKAEALLLQALRFNPSNHEALFYLGNIYFDRAERAAHQTQQKQDDLEKAAEYIGKSIAIHPLFPEGHYDLALVLRQLGKQKEARFHLEKVISLSPDPTSIRVKNAKMLLNSPLGEIPSP